MKTIAKKVGQTTAGIARTAARQAAGEVVKMGQDASQQISGMETVSSTTQQGQTTSQTSSVANQTTPVDAEKIKAQSTRRLQELENEILLIRKKKEQEYQERSQKEAAEKARKEEEEEARKAQVAELATPTGKIKKGITSRVDRMKKKRELGKRPTG